MQIEIVAAVQLFLYGLAWAVAALLIREQRVVLAHWAAYGFLEAGSVVPALPALATAGQVPASALAISLLSYAVGVRGVDQFAGAPRLDRLLAASLVGAAVALAGIRIAGASLADPARAVHAVYSAAAAAIWLGGMPSLWRRLRAGLPRSTVVVALGPGLALGTLALVSLAMSLFVDGDRGTHLREAVRVPNLIASLAGSAVFHFGFLFLFMARLLSRMRQLARHDHLTGTLNRRATDDALASMHQQHARTREPLAAMFVDLDHFKAVNDTRGHAAGDRVLQLVARVLQENSRPYDVVGRWGGEEFVVLMPATRAAAARAAAERFRDEVEGSTRAHLGGAVTVSIGLAVAGDGVAATTPLALLGEADRALYAAKAAGRNCVRLAQDA